MYQRSRQVIFSAHGLETSCLTLAVRVLVFVLLYVIITAITGNLPRDFCL